MADKAVTATLTAATAATFTLDDATSTHVDVTVHTSAVVYVRMDGVTPVGAAAENYPVVGPGFKRFRMPHTGIVKVISAGTPVVTVSAVA